MLGLSPPYLLAVCASIEYKSIYIQWIWMVDSALVVLRDHAVIHYFLNIVLQAENFSKQYNNTKKYIQSKNV